VIVMVVMMIVIMTVAVEACHIATGRWRYGTGIGCVRKGSSGDVSSQFRFQSYLK